MSPMKFELDQEALSAALLAVVTESGVSLEGKHTRITFKKKDGQNVAVVEVSTEPFLEVQRDPNAPKRGRKPKSVTEAAPVVEQAAEEVTEEAVIESAVATEVTEVEAEPVAEEKPATKPAAKKKALFAAD